MLYTYILKCSDDSYYTGSTWNLERRIEQHGSGKGAKHTSIRLPVELVYFEYYKSIKSAFNREKQIQKWSKKKKEALINQNYSILKIISKKKFNAP